MTFSLLDFRSAFGDRSWGTSPGLDIAPSPGGAIDEFILLWRTMFAFCYKKLQQVRWKIHEKPVSQCHVTISKPVVFSSLWENVNSFHLHMCTSGTTKYHISHCSILFFMFMHGVMTVSPSLSFLPSWFFDGREWKRPSGCIHPSIRRKINVLPQEH